MMKSENELIELVNNGDKTAFDYIYKRYAPRLKRYAYRFTQDTSASEDIIQECFTAFWERREEIKSVALTSLLFTIVRNTCINYLKHKELLTTENLEYLKNIEGEERLYNHDFEFNPESSIVYNELLSQVNSIIPQLPERCREVFILSRMKGLKNREIADKLNISTTAVEKHISKAIQFFKSKLER